jgi:hypothetical protein
MRVEKSSRRLDFQNVQVCTETFLKGAYKCAAAKDCAIARTNSPSRHTQHLPDVITYRFCEEHFDRSRSAVSPLQPSACSRSNDPRIIEDQDVRGIEEIGETAELGIQNTRGAPAHNHHARRASGFGRRARNQFRRQMIVEVRNVHGG